MTFNQDIGRAFNLRHQLLGGRTTSAYASAFNQDLGWCVDGGKKAFYNTDVRGDVVRRHSRQAPCLVRLICRRPAKGPAATAPLGSSPARRAAAFLLAVVAFCFYRRRKASMMDKADEPTRANEPNCQPTVEATPPKGRATIPVAPEGEEEGLMEQPPPPPRRWFSRAEPEPEPAAPAE